MSKPDLTIRLCGPRGFCAGVDRAIQIVVLTSVLILVAPITFMMGWISLAASIACALFGLYITTKAIRLYFDFGNDKAKKLMFSSFAYLPLVLITLLIEALLK